MKEFLHSELPDGPAEDSPTVALLRYVLDCAVANDPDAAAVVAANGFLASVTDKLLDADDDEEAIDAVLDEAAEISTALSALVQRPKPTIHSLVINWSDRDPDQGTFGSTVRAWDHAHAEYLVRAEMERSEDAGSDFTGSVVDHNCGASWMADRLELALRGIVADAAFETPALAKAKALLAEIDAL